MDSMKVELYFWPDVLEQTCLLLQFLIVLTVEVVWGELWGLRARVRWHDPKLCVEEDDAIHVR